MAAPRELNHGAAKELLHPSAGSAMVKENHREPRGPPRRSVV